MRFNTSLPYVFSLVSAAAAATHEVKVGNDLHTLEGLQYSPNVTTAAMGDTVVFHFWPGPHDVVQGDYNNPCNPLTDAFYSGFISPSGTSGEADKVFTITINSTDPIWIYCSETAHCQNGMVAVINPPASGDSLAAYAAGAGKTKTSTAPAKVQGGDISANNNSTSSSSSTSASGSSTPTSSAPASTSSKGAAADITGKNGVLSLISAGLAVAICWAGLI